MVATKPKTHVGSLTMHLGPATCRGRLKPIMRKTQEEEDTATKFCTPEGKPVHRMFRDDEGNCYQELELSKATVDEDGKYHLVDPEALKAAKQSLLPDNILNLTAHYKRDTQRWLWPSDHKAFIFEPVIMENRKIVEDPTNEQWHRFIHAVVSHPEFDVVTLAKIRGSQAIYKLSIYNGYIAVQRQLYPQNLWEYPEQEIGLDARTQELAHSVAHKLVAPFETTAYENDILERVRQVTAEGYDPSVAPVVVKPEPSSINLEDALEAFLAGQQ
jgi:hypothetical protein